MDWSRLIALGQFRPLLRCLHANKSFPAAAATMPWPKSSIPKFGNWDINDYSIVFDKVRAEKERALHVTDGISDIDFSIRNVFPRSDGGIGNRTSQSSPPVKVRGESEGLWCNQENGRFAASHNSKLRHLVQTVEKGTIYNRIGAKESMNSIPRSSLGQGTVFSDRPTAECEEHLNYFSTDSQNFSVAHAYKPQFVSDVPVRQPVQSEATKESQSPDDLWYRQKNLPTKFTYASGLHSKSPDLLRKGRQTFSGEAATKARIPHQGLRVSRSDEMLGRPTVPKFGDWEHADRFTTTFDGMRKQRSSDHAVIAPTVGLASWKLEDDLYKDSEPSKYQRGWWSIICCSRA